MATWFVCLGRVVVTDDVDVDEVGGVVDLDDVSTERASVEFYIHWDSFLSSATTEAKEAMRSRFLNDDLMPR